MDSNKGIYNKIHCGDTLEVMRSLPDEAVELVVTSPPYNVQKSFNKNRKNREGSRWYKSALPFGYDVHQDNMTEDEYTNWQRDCLTEMMRLIPDTGAIFYNHKWRVQKGLLKDQSEILKGFPVRHVIIWQRSGGFNFNEGYFLPTYEVIYLIAKPKFEMTPEGNSAGDVWHIFQGRGNPHPAPFPEELVEKIIMSTTAKSVLDPFSGSGTTSAVAKRLGKYYIGIDNSPLYCEMSEKRIAGLDWK